MTARKATTAALLLVGATVVLGTLFTARAEEGKGPNHDAETKGAMDAKAQAMADYDTACQLADYGRRNNDPIALISAARILKAVTTQAMEAKPETKKSEGEAADGQKEKSKHPPLSAESCLDAAAGMIGEDEALAALIEAVRGEAMREAVGGPQCGTYVLNGRCYQDFVVTFYGGRYAQVTVQGDGDTDLDLFIYDQNGNLIVSDTRAGDYCGVYWTPRWTGPFRIRVVNLGRVWNRYVIATN
ncbi:MAG: hypothetical protein ACT4PV_15765 [Planctomycetaceae bacterium]